MFLLKFLLKTISLHRLAFSFESKQNDKRPLGKKLLSIVYGGAAVKANLEAPLEFRAILN